MYFKTLGLGALVVAAMAALAGTASATTLTSPEGTTYTGFVDATSMNSELDGAFVTVKCGHSDIEAIITGHGIGAASGTVTGMTFSECNYKVTVRATGWLDIDSSNTVKSSGAQIEIATSVGTCIFSTLSTDIGTLTEGSWPKLDINSAKIPRTGGNFLCGSSGTWTGSYSIWNPFTLWVD